jgi:hypothetical protein
MKHIQNAVQVFQQKGPVYRPKCKWSVENIIKMDFEETGCEGVDQTELSQNRVK